MKTLRNLCKNHLLRPRRKTSPRHTEIVFNYFFDIVKVYKNNNCKCLQEGKTTFSGELLFNFANFMKLAVSVIQVFQC